MKRLSSLQEIVFEKTPPPEDNQIERNTCLTILLYRLAGRLALPDCKIRLNIIF